MFLKLKSIQQFSRYSDKGPSKAVRFNRAISDLPKKNLFFNEVMLIGLINYNLSLNNIKGPFTIQ